MTNLQVCPTVLPYWYSGTAKRVSRTVHVRRGGAMTVAAATVEIPAPGEVRRRPYRVAELAERWNIDVSTVCRMIYAGVLHAEGHGPRGGALRVPVDAVAEYERAATVPAAGCPAPPRRGCEREHADRDEHPAAAWVQGEGAGREPEP